MTERHEPVVCTLTTRDAARQALEWGDLQHHALSVERMVGGAAMTFPTGLAARIEDLAARERDCCGFLTIVMSLDSGRLRLEVTSENPDGLPVVEAIAGLDRT